RRKAAVAALEEDQRHRGRRDIEVADRTDHGVVVAGFVDHLDVAVDPGEYTVENRRAGAGRVPGQLRELVATANRKRAAHDLLVGAEDVDAEVPGVAEPWPAARPFVGHERDERRVERHRTERADRHARRTAIGIDTGDDGDAGREMAEDLAEARGVDRARHVEAPADCRNSNFSTLPEALRGSASTTMTVRGAL